ncbi:hypothetical protein M413DRAFT_24852 [Hebeloma cylindrosporum]|uniref:Uncharacterized protein n=1 Tax=Hebeloma cylindrosporum TaxID=76867 RepID=A0A0C2YXN5_HEBCY|nr:hypothetical protein M413DRAFT_24852 [Hebeloma cylindrosporum h7]
MSYIPTGSLTSTETFPEGPILRAHSAVSNEPRGSFESQPNPRGGVCWPPIFAILVGSLLDLKIRDLLGNAEEVAVSIDDAKDVEKTRSVSFFPFSLSSSLHASKLAQEYSPDGLIYPHPSGADLVVDTASLPSTPPTLQIALVFTAYHEEWEWPRAVVDEADL